jgi:hypothetical protein
VPTVEDSAVITACKNDQFERLRVHAGNLREFRTRLVSARPSDFKKNFESPEWFCTAGLR